MVDDVNAKPSNSGHAVVQKQYAKVTQHLEAGGNVQTRMHGNSSFPLYCVINGQGNGKASWGIPSCSMFQFLCQRQSTICWRMETVVWLSKRILGALQGKLRECNFVIGGFPKIRGTLWGAPIIRISILGFPDFGKLPYNSVNLTRVSWFPNTRGPCC